MKNLVSRVEGDLMLSPIERWQTHVKSVFQELVGEVLSDTRIHGISVIEPSNPSDFGLWRIQIEGPDRNMGTRFESYSYKGVEIRKRPVRRDATNIDAQRFLLVKQIDEYLPWALERETQRYYVLEPNRFDLLEIKFSQETAQGL